MRTFLLILLVISGTVFAQDEPPSFFDFLKGIGKSDCEAYLDNGDALINASNKAANADDWDAAFYYDDQAFHAYLKAYGHCEESENKTKATDRLDQSKLHGNQLACFYHLKEATSADKRASLAVNHLKSASIALKHQQQALIILSKDAERFCSFDDSLSNEVDQFKENVTTKIDKLEAYIAEHGDDSIDVPDVPEIP